MRCDPIILAAGRGTRLGLVKALAQLGEHTFLQIIVRSLEAAGARRPLVIIGADAPRVRAAHTGLDVEWCVNDAWAHTDMIASLRLGLRASTLGEPVLIWPVDCPHGDALLIRQLAAAISPLGASAAVPTFAGRPGHPVALSATAAAALRDSEHGSLRAYLACQSARVTHVEATSEGVLSNINNPADLPGDTRTLRQT